MAKIKVETCAEYSKLCRENGRAQRTHSHSQSQRHIFVVCGSRFNGVAIQYEDGIHTMCDCEYWICHIPLLASTNKLCMWYANRFLHYSKVTRKLKHNRRETNENEEKKRRNERVALLCRDSWLVFCFMIFCMFYGLFLLLALTLCGHWSIPLSLPDDDDDVSSGTWVDGWRADYFNLIWPHQCLFRDC